MAARVTGNSLSSDGPGRAGPNDGAEASKLMTIHGGGCSRMRGETGRDATVKGSEGRRHGVRFITKVRPALSPPEGKARAAR